MPAAATGRPSTGRSAGPDADERADRRSPPSGLSGRKSLPDRVTQDNPGAVRPPPPEAFPTSEFPIPDRYRCLRHFCPEGRIDLFTGINASVCHSTRDPYHQNVLKGDRPLCLPTEEEQQHRKEAGIPRCATPQVPGAEARGLVFRRHRDQRHVVEPRSFPTPQGVQTTVASRQPRRVRPRAVDRRVADLPIRGVRPVQGIDRVQAARDRV